MNTPTRNYFPATAKQAKHRWQTHTRLVLAAPLLKRIKAEGCQIKDWTGPATLANRTFPALYVGKDKLPTFVFCIEGTHVFAITHTFILKD